MARIEHNADGASIATLDEPVRIGDVEHTRVTIPKLRGRHMFSCPVIEATGSIGVVIRWAAEVVEPRGVVEEMSPDDATDIARALLQRLKKTPKTGEPSSD